MKPLLEAREVTRSYRSRGLARRGRVLAVDRVSLTVAPGSTLAVIGASGSGKSTLCRLLLGLECPDSGSVHFDGHQISHLPAARLRPLRRRFQPVFQDPYASLNPRLRLAAIIAEPLVAHGLAGPDRGRSRARELLALVGLPADAIDQRPGSFSGGERQRIAIARALATSPDLVILDEPVSALDRSVRSHILHLLADLKLRLRLTMVLVSHDIAVVADVAERVVVLDRGRSVEAGAVSDVLATPRHPATRALVRAARTHRG
jgi:ABC-type glutathione transport system ATPase component